MRSETESVIGGLFGLAGPPPESPCGTLPGSLSEGPFGDLARDADVTLTASGRGGILLIC